MELRKHVLWSMIGFPANFSKNFSINISASWLDSDRLNFTLHSQAHFIALLGWHSSYNFKAILVDPVFLQPIKWYDLQILWIVEEYWLYTDFLKGEACLFFTWTLAGFVSNINFCFECWTSTNRVLSASNVQLLATFSNIWGKSVILSCFGRKLSKI